MMREATSPARNQPPCLLMMGNLQDAGGHRTSSGRRMFYTTTETTTMDRSNGTRARRGPRYRSVSNPRWMEERQKIAGEVLGMCAGTQRAIANAFQASDVPGSEGWVSQMVRGNPAVSAHMDRVEALASATWADAGPLAAAPFGVLCRVRGSQLSDRGLEEAMLHSLQVETEREGLENTVQCRRLLARSVAQDDVASLEDELARAFVLSMASEAAALGLLWERRRRRVGQ